MAHPFENISAQRPFVANSYNELLAGVAILISEATGRAILTPMDEPVQETMYSTRTVQKLLKEKGYKVTSYPGLNKVLDTHGVQPVKKGKVNFYHRAEIDAIPTV